MKQLLLSLAFIALLLTMVACDKDIEPSPGYTHSLTDIVTYTGLDQAGNAQYDLIGRDGSVRVLTTSADVVEGIKPPVRLIMRFYYDNEATGSIKVFDLARAITDSLRVGQKPIDQYAQHPVRMRSAWRTGDFINIHCLAEYTGKSRAMMMLVDDATRNNDTVHCYLHHDLHEWTPLHWRECFISVNVGNVWKNTNCTTVRLHINDAMQGEVCYDFER